MCGCSCMLSAGPHCPESLVPISPSTRQPIPSKTAAPSQNSAAPSSPAPTKAPVGRAVPCCACAIDSCRLLTVAANTAGWAAQALTSARVLTPCRCERQVNLRMRQFLRLEPRLQLNRSSATHSQPALVRIRSFQLEL
jgi:hypothetical protein